MAENIGKIVVSIEAEVAELRKGLAQAEAEFKKSAKKIEEQQKTLGTQIKKSWTELASKISVYQMAIGAAEKAVDLLGESMRILGDDSMESHDKTIAMFDAFSNSGIPIVAEFSGLVQSLGYLFSDLGEAQKGVIETQIALAGQQQKMGVAKSLQAGIESLERQVRLSEAILEIDHARERGQNGILAKYDAQIIAMQDQFDAANKAEEQRLRESAVSNKFYDEQMQKRKDLQAQLMDILTQKEESELRVWKKREAEKQKIIADNVAREKQRAIDDAKEIADKATADAKAIADKTLDLQTKLNIMLAKQAGDEEKALIIAIEARYDKMLEDATDANREIIEEMKEIEMAAVVVAGAAGAADVAKVTPTTTGGGGTASISTAAGAFTVASGRGVMNENKKQTSLLRRIADSTMKISETTSSAGIIPPV